MEGLQTAAPSFADDQQGHQFTSRLDELVETARRELERDRDAAKASLVIVVISGELEAIINGSARMTLRPGQLIGDVSAYSGLASPADVVARGPVTLAKWVLEQVREFTASRPELRANLLRMVSVDLAVKLLDIANAGHDLVAEKLVQD